MITIKVINKSNYSVPDYATPFSSGIDLFANIAENVTIKPFQRILIPTGLFIEIPDGYEAQIRPRSGLALKHGLTVLNTPGTIDSDYRGEIQVIIINFGNLDFVVEPGLKIAQMVFSKYEKVEFIEVDKLNDSPRGNGGFGHTGL